MTFLVQIAELKKKAETPGQQRVVNFLERLGYLSNGGLKPYNEMRRVDRGIIVKWSGAPAVSFYIVEDSDDAFWEVDVGSKSIGSRITKDTPHIPQILEEALKAHYAVPRHDFSLETLRQYVG